MSLSPAEQAILQKIVVIIRRETGNRLSDRDQSMILSRLSRRISKLGLQGFTAYSDYFDANRSEETKYLVGLLTTHHTYFFREFSHFEFLEKNIQQLAKTVKLQGRKTLDIWCPACSTGQEVYSFAIYVGEV